MKILKKVLAVSLVVVMLLAFASCGKSDLQQFSEKVSGDNANYKMTIKMNYGSMIMEIPAEVNGNVIHMQMEMFGEKMDIYEEQVEGGFWTYSQQEEGKWVKMFASADDADAASESEMPVDLNNIKEEDFELKDGKYVLKADKMKDYSEGLEISAFSIEIEKNAAKAVIEMTVSGEEVGGSMSYTITVYDFGKVEKITLPEAEEYKIEDEFDF